jgi:hypothetical protein
MTNIGGVVTGDMVSERAEGRSRTPVIALITQKYGADTIAVASLLLVTFAAVFLRIVYDNWLAESDLITFFIPWFGYIGDRLGDGELPVWSNNYLGGVPVIGSPSSGWLYLPVMVLFPFLNVVTAFKTLVLVQAVIGGVATYVLARRVALQPVAAFAASAAFVLGPLIYESTRYTLVGSQVTTWIPVGIVAADLALCARRSSAVVGWSALAGLAMSQMIVAWPGQGMLYGFMWIGAWMLYRSFAMPLDPVSRVRTRLGRIVGSGAVMAIAGIGLSAAALLPVFNISEQSTIPGGDYSNVLGGSYASTPHQFKILLYYLFSADFNVRAEGFSGGLLALALFGGLLAGRRYGAIFFASVFLVGLSLSVEHSPTRPFFDLIPGFAHFHGHRPIAIVWILSLAPAMLAGAAVQEFVNRKAKPLSQVLILGAIATCVVLVAQVNSLGSWIGWNSILPMFTVIAVFCIPSTRDVLTRWISPERLHSVGVAVLLVIILMFPTGYDAVKTIISPETPDDETTQFLGKDDETSAVTEDVLSRTDPGTAAEFLQQQQQLLAPFRFTGYSGQGYPTTEYQWVYNTYWWRRMEPNVIGLLVNARTLRLDLQQTSGYNPVQLGPYAEYIDEMNGAKQDYHWSDTYADALVEDDSPLLDMLNVRYILVDIAIPTDREDHAAILDNYEEVFRDEHVIVYENTDAYDRAWIVHDVRPNNDGEGLEALNDGRFDGRRVAFVDGEIPETLVAGEAAAPSISGESVTTVNLEQESMSLRVTAAADGLVVVSSSYADGWVAYVDGRKVDILRTNHAFLGVPVTAGDHLVQLRYEPRGLQVGLYFTAVTGVGVLTVWAWAAVDSRRRGSRSGVASSVQRVNDDGTIE